VFDKDAAQETAQILKRILYSDFFMVNLRRH
jgi:hypothetical protein